MELVWPRKGSNIDGNHWNWPMAPFKVQWCHSYWHDITNLGNARSRHLNSSACNSKAEVGRKMKTSRGQSNGVKHRVVSILVVYYLLLVSIVEDCLACLCQLPCFITTDKLPLAVPNPQPCTFTSTMALGSIANVVIHWLKQKLELTMTVEGYTSHKGLIFVECREFNVLNMNKLAQ